MSDTSWGGMHPALFSTSGCQAGVENCLELEEWFYTMFYYVKIILFGLQQNAVQYCTECTCHRICLFNKRRLYIITGLFPQIFLLTCISNHQV